jgi:O-antigen/teichoic acid export membrane protein
VLSGLFWAGGARLLGQIFTWAITIVVIRVLTPDDYGLLAMAMVLVSLLYLTSEAGLDTALVQASDVDEHKLRGIFGAVILIDFALFAFLFVAAPAIAYFFDEDRLVWIIRVLALQFVLPDPLTSGASR